MGMRHRCSCHVDEAEQRWRCEANEQQANESEGPSLRVDNDRDNAAEDECSSTHLSHLGDPTVDETTMEEINERNRTAASHNPRRGAGDEHGNATEDDAHCSNSRALPPMEDWSVGQFPARACTARSMPSSPARIADRPTSSRTA